MKQKIQDKYGFTPTDEYVADFIAFVQEIIAGEEDESSFDGSDEPDVSAK